MASWIEMLWSATQLLFFMSRLMWPRGLKYYIARLHFQHATVEAYVASWIEIYLFITSISSGRVEAYVASWIEIS